MINKADFTSLNSPHLETQHILGMDLSRITTRMPRGALLMLAKRGSAHVEGYVAELGIVDAFQQSGQPMWT